MLKRIGPGRGNEFLAQALVRGMQTHRQGELGPSQTLEGALRQGRQRVGHPNGAHRDLPLGHAQIPTKTIDRGEHGINIQQWLSHAHEHHMAGPLLHHLTHTEDLVNDLVHGQ